MKLLFALLTILALAPRPVAADTSSQINVPLSVQVTVPTWQVPVNQPVTILGMPYQLTGTLTLSPLPPASGTAPTINQVLNSTGAPVTSAAGGSALTLTGANLGTGGTLTVAGLGATVTQWSPTTILFTLPKPAGGTASGPIVVTPTGGSPVTSGFAFTITQASAGGSDLQPWLFVAGYEPMEAGDGAGQIKSGHRVMLVGHDFGEENQNCRVEINSAPAAIVSWLDTAIVAEVPSGPDTLHPATVLVWRQPDQCYLGMASFRVTPS